MQYTLYSSKLGLSCNLCTVGRCWKWDLNYLNNLNIYTNNLQTFTSVQKCMWTPVSIISVCQSFSRPQNICMNKQHLHLLVAIAIREYETDILFFFSSVINKLTHRMLDELTTYTINRLDCSTSGCMSLK